MFGFERMDSASRPIESGSVWVKRVDGEAVDSNGVKNQIKGKHENISV